MQSRKLAKPPRHHPGALVVQNHIDVVHLLHDQTHCFVIPWGKKGAYQSTKQCTYHMRIGVLCHVRGIGDGDALDVPRVAKVLLCFVDGTASNAGRVHHTVRISANCKKQTMQNAALHWPMRSLPSENMHARFGVPAQATLLTCEPKYPKVRSRPFAIGKRVSWRQL